MENFNSIKSIIQKIYINICKPFNPICSSSTISRLIIQINYAHKYIQMIHNVI